MIWFNGRVLCSSLSSVCFRSRQCFSVLSPIYPGAVGLPGRCFLAADSAYCVRPRGRGGNRPKRSVGLTVSARHIFMSGEMASKTISIDDYDVYGFDIDHTAAQYHIVNLFDLIHSGIAKFLVDKKGYGAYSKDLLEPFSKWKDFCYRGLAFDIKNGNLLKVAADGTILRAAHGTKFMSQDEIASCYEDRHWSLTDKLLNSVDNITNKKGVREIMIFDNMFDMIGTVMLGRIVDVIDKENGKPLDSYESHYNAVIAAYNDAYGFLNFSSKEGLYFPSVIEEPQKYISSAADSTKTWLKALRKKGKATFFLTSSYSDYAEYVFKSAYGGDWMEYFDIGICRGRKPTFFTDNRPFLRIENHKEREPVQTLEKGKFYSQGNHKELIKFLSNLTGKENPKVLYFGDSMRSDIFPARMYADWDTVAIIDEIRLEPSVDEDEDDGPGGKRQKLEESDLLTSEYICSKAWGSFFYDSLANAKEVDKETEKRSLNTLWGAIVHKYATIAVPSLQHIADLPSDHKFPAFSKEANEYGFSPYLPKVLQK